VLILWVKLNTVDLAVFCFSAEIPKVHAGKRKMGDILLIKRGKARQYSDYTQQ
jgi:hypothetical protein